jgi:hypothetical protein
MPSAKKPRLNMSAAGSYVSISGALSDADEGIKHVLKMGLITRRPEKSSVENNELEIAFLTDHVLVDLESFVASAIDEKKIIKDCEFIKEIALKHPGELKQLAEAYLSSPTGFDKAAAIADKIGLTEKAAVKAGGGMAALVVLLIVAILAKSCQDAKNGNPQGKPKPAQ